MCRYCVYVGVVAACTTPAVMCDIGQITSTGRLRQRHQHTTSHPHQTFNPARRPAVPSGRRGRRRCYKYVCALDESAHFHTSCQSHTPLSAQRYDMTLYVLHQTRPFN